MIRVAWRVLAARGGAFAVTCLATVAALAETGDVENSNPHVATETSGDAPHFSLGIGTGLSLGLSDIEERGSDTVDISSSVYLWNLSVSPRYQLSQAWAVGLRGSWASDAGARGRASSSGVDVGVARDLWHVAAEGRYQPGRQRGPYVAASAGYVGAADSIGGASAWQWAPALCTAAGYDAFVAEPLSLGVELRGAFAFFDGEGAELTYDAETYRYVYRSNSWVSLNVIGYLAL